MDLWMRDGNSPKTYEIWSKGDWELGARVG